MSNQELRQLFDIVEQIEVKLDKLLSLEARLNQIRGQLEALRVVSQTEYFWAL